MADHLLHLGQQARGEDTFDIEPVNLKANVLARVQRSLPTLEPQETRGATPIEIQQRKERIAKFSQNNILASATRADELIRMGVSARDIPSSDFGPWVIMNALGMAGPARGMLAAKAGVGGAVVAGRAGVKAHVTKRPDVWEIGKIETPKGDRGQGLAEAKLNEILEEADAVGVPVSLTPTADFGANKSKLIAWYKRHGFVPNKGKAKDFSTRESMIRPVKSVSSNILAAKTGAGGTAVAANQGIKAYHGSPHSFDKFSMENIGTGEGAQAYGHGLYFAEKEGTARSYRDALSNPTWQGSQVQSEVRNALKSFDNDQDAISHLHNKMMEARNTGNTFEAGVFQDAVNNFTAIKQQVPKGSMYEVNINAHPDDFLDWDKPLSEQSARVRENLKSYLKEREPSEGFWNADLGSAEAAMGRRGTDPTGADIYSDVSELYRVAGSKDNRGMAANEMFSEGIPGIKYLDQGSRATSKSSGAVHLDTVQDGGMWRAKIKMDGPPTGGAMAPEQIITSSKPYKTKAEADEWARSKTESEGTRNFVLFRDDIIDIVKKYGIAGAAVTLGMSETEIQGITQ